MLPQSIGFVELVLEILLSLHESIAYLAHYYLVFKQLMMHNGHLEIFKLKLEFAAKDVLNQEKL